MAVRLRDVAEHAGVSVKTVSNVVHGHPSVSRSMRAKVESSIAALGYVPNMSARSLRTGRSGLVGLAVPRDQRPLLLARRGGGHRRRGGTRALGARGADRRGPDRARPTCCSGGGRPSSTA